ncbi:Retinal homeobox protein Rx1 [Acipenser ruthenus]|uniref:Retinal homeobox protein Rx1 n=1 Tax=Acipenser ruthenus TaxID=7906 RepID=A0A444V3H6_ACIRT|nr:Retinal homeobox protein Rx1 [Acipenser ruthenus]
MHLSLDSMSMVDDSCLSPGNFHEMVKAGGAAVGGRVHSIDVILGFSKDQDPLLNPGGPGTHKSGMESLGDPGKPDPTNPYGHLSSLRDHSDHAAFHGKDLRKPLDLLVPRLHGAQPTGWLIRRSNVYDIRCARIIFLFSELLRSQ